MRLLPISLVPAPGSRNYWKFLEVSGWKRRGNDLHIQGNLTNPQPGDCARYLGQNINIMEPGQVGVVVVGWKMECWSCEACGGILSLGELRKEKS